MEKIIRWSCFTASACIVAAFLFALYISTLLPDTFHVGETGEIRVAGHALSHIFPGAGAGGSRGQCHARGLLQCAAFAGRCDTVKTVRAEVLGRRVVQVCGTPFGIKMFANGAMVVGFSDIYTAQGYQNPAKTAGLKLGDVIVSIAGHETRTNEDVAEALQQLKGAPAEVVFQRDGHEKTVRLTAVMDLSTNTYRTGMWVRDSSAGIGTMTFIDNATGTFAGLGHSIHDSDTGKTLGLLKGEIVPVEITGVEKGSAGAPGELKGRFLTAAAAGDITVNGETGVYGTVSSVQEGIDMELALAQEVTTGRAEIITTIEGRTPQRYEVEIEKIALNASDANRNMVVHVTDPVLLQNTGGIVQGMSGSPIIQNGKLVGAVTHVLVNDPTRGYGIFAENMLETAEAAAGRRAA